MVGGNPLKKAAILGLVVALASTLLLVIPDDDEQDYALEASTEETGETGDSEETPASIREVAGETGASSEADTARLALATEAALAGAEHSLREGSAIISFADDMASARAAAAAFATTSTVAIDPAPAAPSTTRAKAVPKTTAAQTASTDAETSTTAGDPAPSSSETSAAADTTATTVADQTTETSADPAADTTVADTAAPETTAPATTVPETTPETTAAAPGWVDAGHGVAVPQVLLSIRYCESRDNYTAANPSSSARGAYQFLTGSWDAYGHKARYGVSQAHLATPAQQDEAALITWQRDGTRPWNASRSCWA